MPESDISKVKRALGEPLMPEFSDYMRRVRGLLIVVSLISIAVVIGGLTIDPSSSVLGVRFHGLSDELVRKGIFLVNTYLLFHFIWGSFDSWLEWEARVTGTKLSYVTTGMASSEHADYPNDPRQSTLYNWWMDSAHRISSLIEPLDTMEKKLSVWEAQVGDAILKDDPNLGTIFSSFRKIGSNIAGIERQIKNVEKTLSANRIPVSLERFDKRFELMLRSQNLRWLLLELSFPILLGCWAVWLLLNEF